MNAVVKQFRDFFVSLKLTVVLLVLSIILIFAATWAQKDYGIWEVQKTYFRTFVVLYDVRGIPIPVFPGGYFIGGLLFINLISAHLYRFKMSWRKSGIFLTHVGLILLLVGELLSGIWQKEYHIRLNEGESKSYAESSQYYELAITEITNPDHDDVVVIPQEVLARGDSVQHPSLPFRVVTRGYFTNVDVSRRSDTAPATQAQTVLGLGTQFVATPAPDDYRPDALNVPAAYVELVGAEGSLGTWLTFYVPPEVVPESIQTKTFTAAGRNWKIALRPEREYKPFSLTLLDFKHDIYPGTDIPKNFSSRVRLETPDKRDDREVLIYMNNPLRYQGLTFFQAGFEKGNDHFTILQVVRNPSWQLPYISCALMALGLVTQFGIHLGGFIRSRS